MRTVSRASVITLSVCRLLMRELLSLSAQEPTAKPRLLTHELFVPELCHLLPIISLKARDFLPTEASDFLVISVFLILCVMKTLVRLLLGLPAAYEFVLR